MKAYRFDLKQILLWGTLPEIFNLHTAEDKSHFLRAYALTYLKEEIIAEQIIRKLQPFRFFLEVAAQSNGKIINFTRIANDIGVDTQTVQSYFTILEDTLVGCMLPSYHKSIRKRQRSNPKFYYFDTGVKRALDRTLTLDIQEGTYSYGLAFEHFIILEIMRMSSYKNNDWRFSCLKTKDNAEIDLIIERPGMPEVLIEIKSTRTIQERDVAALDRFVKDFASCEAFCISRDIQEKKIRSVRCLHWEKALGELGLD
jgi:predicted AAA+ superfamily ATPase